MAIKTNSKYFHGFLVSLLLLFVNASQAVFAETNPEPQPTKIIINDQLEMAFEGEARLSEVLEAALNQWREQVGQRLNVYWPGARLAMVAGEYSQQAELEEKRLQLITTLQNTAENYLKREQREQAAQLLSLAEQLSQMVLAWQPFGQPKLAASRLFIEDNPVLTQGIYHLYLPERAPYLYIYGLTKSHGQQPVFSQQTVRGYLKPHLDNDLLWPNASKREVYYFDYAKAGAKGGNDRIQDKGQDWVQAWVQKVPWGLHNANDVQVMPGDLLFIGFETGALAANGLNLTEEGRTFTYLNEQFVGLLAHWWSDPSAQKMDSSIVHQVEQRIPDLNHWERLDLSPTRNNYGGVGLLQTPTARMAEEGEAILGYTDMKEYRRYSASIQVLPWLEASGFYVRAPYRLYSQYPGFSGNNIYTDKGFDVKARVWQETDYTPEISVGLSDFAGTGLFSSEYMVASKRFGPLDVSLGLGFGRLGTRDTFPNPFCEVASSFCERTGGTSGKGGKLETSKWFRGDAAIFGGVEYQTPWQPLRLKLEYEGNDYSADRAGIEIKPKTPFNIGLTYRPYDWLDLQFGVERGDIISLGFVLRTNLNTLKQVRVQPDKVEVAMQAPQRELNEVSWVGMTRKMREQYAYGDARFQLEPLSHIGEPEAYVARAYVNPYRYRNSEEAVERAARVMANELPESVKTYELVEQGMFMPQVMTRIQAEDFRKQINNAEPPQADLARVEGAQAEENKPLQAKNYTYERTNPPQAKLNFQDESWQDITPYHFKPAFSMQPFFFQDFGAPETFHFYQLGLKGSMQYWLNEKTWLVTDVGVNIANNFDKFNFKVDAFDELPLPRVRTYSREYIDHNFWIDTLQLTRFERLGEDFYAMGYAGLLERMYAGVGGEVLWRPLDAPLALGLDFNWVKQRAFNGWLGTRDYSTATGFLTAYYQMPWLKDSLLQVGVGQFLARDKGAAIQFQRRFDSGIIVGAFANITNVSAREYGEGSFTKGVFMRIPFDLLTVSPNRKHIGFDWVPLSRDGGQQLHRRISLYGTTDARSPYYLR